MHVPFVFILFVVKCTEWDVCIKQDKGLDISSPCAKCLTLYYWTEQCHIRDTCRKRHAASTLIATE